MKKGGVCMKYLLRDHWVSPPFVEETIPWVQSPGGTLFVPIIGTVFHAHRHQAAEDPRPRRAPR